MLAVLEVSEVPEVIRRALLRILEAVEGERSLLKLSEVMHSVLLCML